jgi:hypothetical protein
MAQRQKRNYGLAIARADRDEWKGKLDAKDAEIIAKEAEKKRLNAKIDAEPDLVKRDPLIDLRNGVDEDIIRLSNERRPIFNKYSAFRNEVIRLEKKLGIKPWEDYPGEDSDNEKRQNESRLDTNHFREMAQESASVAKNSQRQSAQPEKAQPQYGMVDDAPETSSSFAIPGYSEPAPQPKGPVNLYPDLDSPQPEPLKLVRRDGQKLKPHEALYPGMAYDEYVHQPLSDAAEQQARSLYPDFPKPRPEHLPPVYDKPEDLQDPDYFDLPDNPTLLDPGHHGRWLRKKARNG